jgi:SAM-dependent methyltransferase
MSDYEYSGQDFLESLEDAHHYNGALMGLMRSHAKDKASILDFGAGCGTFSKLWKDQKFSISAVEPDPTLNSKLREKGISTFSSIDQLTDQDQFDLIYTLNVLEHIEDDFGTAQKLYAHLKPGGTLFIYVPAFQFLYSDFDQKVGHVRRYSKDRLESLAHSIPSAKLLKLSYFDTMGFLLAWIFKMLRFRSDRVTAEKILMFDRWIFPLNGISDRLIGRWMGKNLYLAVQKVVS